MTLEESGINGKNRQKPLLCMAAVMTAARPRQCQRQRTFSKSGKKAFKPLPDSYRSHSADTFNVFRHFSSVPEGRRKFPPTAGSAGGFIECAYP
jgi:hypothetical protein